MKPKEILNKEDLTCSIGVAANKMVAEIASDYRRPYGLTAVKEEDVLEFLFPLKVRALPGVGPKTERRLRELKIETIRDLAAANPEMLTRLFGVWGFRLHEFAHGIDYGEVKEERETKSVGREVTFEKDADDEDLILDALDELAKDVHKEVIGSALQFKTITIKVRYQHFDTHTRANSMGFNSRSFKTFRMQTSKARPPLRSFLRSRNCTSYHNPLLIK